MNLEWGGQIEQVGLNLLWQFQQVHDLSHTGSRKTLADCDFGLVEVRIVLHLLTPGLGQQEWMEVYFPAWKRFFNRHEKVENASREGDRVNGKGSDILSGTGDADS